MWVSMTLSDLSYLRKGTFFRRSYSLTWNDQILHRNTCGGGTCFEVSHAPIPRRWDPTSPKTIWDLLPKPIYSNQILHDDQIR